MPNSREYGLGGADCRELAMQDRQLGAMDLVRSAIPPVSDRSRLLGNMRQGSAPAACGGDYSRDAAGASTPVPREGAGGGSGKDP
jgi:hypothetical protein